MKHCKILRNFFDICTKFFLFLLIFCNFYHILTTFNIILKKFCKILSNFFDIIRKFDDIPCNIFNDF